MLESVQTDRNTGSIYTGNRELDKSIGGGIPFRTLMLMEGQSAAGKSTLS
ncbi:MAG: flagellar accessory protein FlaH, partial [Chloroflexi bacterium]|nr:flagellar accessory protein FlaH [Chloroflexota bacterium]